MTIFLGIALLLLVIGIVEALVKRLFRLAIMFGVFAALLLGAAVYVIATMR